MYAKCAEYLTVEMYAPTTEYIYDENNVYDVLLFSTC